MNRYKREREREKTSTVFKNKFAHNIYIYRRLYT